MQSMLTPTVATDSGTAAPAALGLGWFLTSIGGHRNLHHGGGTNGQLSSFAVFPDDGLVVAVLTNDQDEGGKLTETVERDYFEKLNSSDSDNGGAFVKLP